MTEIELETLIKEVAQETARQIREDVCGENGICPLGLTRSNARAVRCVLAAAWWSGALFAGTVVTAFAGGFTWLIVEGLRVFFDN